MKKNIILAMLLLITAVTAGFTQDNNKSLLFINKTAKIEVEPDLAILTIGINQKHADAQYLKEQANKKINSFVQRVKIIGLQDKEIKTQSYNLYPVYNWQKKKRVFQHYQLTQNIQLKVIGKTRIQLLAKAIDIAMEEDLNNIGNIQFACSPELHTKTEQQAYKQASTQALNTAKDIISHLGLNYVSIYQIKLNQSHNNYYHNHMPRMMEDRAMMSASSKQTQLQTGTTTVQATVSLQVEYR